MVYVTAVTFRAPKAGNSDSEWEDFACLDEQAGPGRARFLIGDGATEAYDSQRWGQQIIAAFDRNAPVGESVYDEARLRAVFADAQRLWAHSAPRQFATVFEERKHAEGSFATVLCLEVLGLEGDRPMWRASALGDTVLFHIRDGCRTTHFPAIEIGEFRSTPSGVSTRPEELDNMCAGLAFDGGELSVGDQLYVATDALAEWLLVRSESDGRDLWGPLSTLECSAAFSDLIAEHRRSGQLQNDDVTLLRVDVSSCAPDSVVVSI